MSDTYQDHRKSITREEAIKSPFPIVCRPHGLRVADRARPHLGCATCIENRKRDNRAAFEADRNRKA